MLFTTPAIIAKAAYGGTPQVILDTAMVDDPASTVALQVAAALHKAGKINLVGVMTNSSNAYSAPCVYAILYQNGLGSIPVGAYMGSGTPSASTFTSQVTARFNPNPSDTRANYTDATALLRTLYAAAPDGSIVYAYSGFGVNAQNLLQSSGDGISPLTGFQLFYNKTQKIVIIGGDYPDSTTAPGGAEYNFQQSPAAWHYIFANQTSIPTLAWGYTAPLSVNFIVAANGGDTVSPCHYAQTLWGAGSGRPAWDAMTAMLCVHDYDYLWYEGGHQGVIGVNASTGANDFTGGATMATPVAIGHAVNNSASSIAMTTTANAPAGACIVVAAAFAQSTSSSITSMTDGVNTYTKQAGGWINNSPDVCTEIWTTGPIGAQLNAGATITANFSQASDAFGNFISAAYVQGMTATADRVNGTNPNGTIDPSISVTGGLNYPAEVVFGVTICYCASTASFAEKNNFTSIDSRATGFGRYYDFAYLNIPKNSGARPYYSTHITASNTPYVNCVIATFPANFSAGGTGTDSYLLKADTDANWLTALHALADTII